MELCKIIGQRETKTVSRPEIKESKERKGPEPNPDLTHRLGHGLVCLEAVPRQKPQCDESVSLDIEGIKSPF